MEPATFGVPPMFGAPPMLGAPELPASSGVSALPARSVAPARAAEEFESPTPAVPLAVLVAPDSAKPPAPELADGASKS